MQINFYMDAEDRRGFHDFIFARGGYLLPEVWPAPSAPCFSSAADVPSGRHTLKIFREDIFPRSSFDDPEWITPYPQFHGYFIHGPGMQYSPSWQDEAGIHRGRIYMGLVSESSFLKPGSPRADIAEVHRTGYRNLVNFYNACCRYVRKNLRKDDAGFYHGAGSDRAGANGVMKLQI